MPILQNLRAVRESRALSQIDLARLAKTTQPTISELEGGRSAQISTLRKLARALRVQPAQLIGPSWDG
ncbi:MAG TPA: helix-turn-helix transcriptional regulator [Methylomirabilota bacterium]|nr:helix-turn-helix transcriptional regulator [Methylomirabilota bacterium]